MSSLYAGLIFVCFCNLFVVESTVANRYDICSNASGHRIYLQYGDVSVIEAKTLMVETVDNVTIKSDCYLEVVTCPSCVIFLNFRHLNLSHRCNNGPKPNLSEYIQITEKAYEDESRKLFCGTNDEELHTHTTQTKTMAIRLIYNRNIEHAFTAEISSQRNKISLTGDRVYNDEDSKNFFTSPYFPLYYLHDLSVEYVISCPETIDNSCRIRLLFSDFQLALVSVMEFFDSNGQRVDVATGSQFRPAVVVTNGPSIMIRFYANSGTGIGYKAFYSFISDKDDTNRTEYNTDCGGYVDNLGGGITMMNMVEKGMNGYYCFWIIRPPKTFLHFKTHLYLKVVNFTFMEDGTELLVQQGSTSIGKVLEVLRQPNPDMYQTNPREHIQPIETGFYVSFKGAFNTNSRLAIVYTAFTYKDCFSEADFLCENHRCIPRQLTCDGFDHCGDNSDEPATCFGGTDTEPVDRRWYSHTPNYFFPKIDPYSDLKTATLVFLISSLGLISLVAALFVLLYRINTRTRHERELQNQLQIISDLLEEETDDTSSAPDEPPVYEAPPDYDEIIKVDTLNDQSTGDEQRTKPRRPRRKRRRQRVPKPQDTNDSLQNTSECPVNVQTTNNPTPSPPPGYGDALMQVCCGNNLEVPLVLNTSNEAKCGKFLRKSNVQNPLMYLSDKSISSNVRQILKRRWHSQNEMAAEDEPSTSASGAQKPSKQPACIFQGSVATEPRRSGRETASDSELLNIESTTDDDREFENGPFHFFKSERVTQLEKGLFDYFRRRSGCQCEGACGCQQARGKAPSRKFKKMPKKKHSHFYTR